MTRVFIVVSALLFVFTQFSFGQIDSLVNSGDVINEGKRLYDSGTYDLSIKQFLRIDPRDTNYLYSLSELADVYLANKQFDEAISTCSIVLGKPSIYRASMLNSRARAYGLKGDFEKARALFESGIEEFPFDYNLQYQFGKMLYINKMYSDSEKALLATLFKNPYHSGAHLYLATIAMQRGEKVRGMMAMGLYLAINPTMNTQLVTLEHFVKNELTDELSIDPSEENPFSKIDEIIRAKIAMEDEYKVKIKVNAGVVNQYQMLFEQLSTQNFKEDDQWVKFYVPIYKAIVNAKMQEPFVYHLLESTPIKEVAVWTKKNGKTLQQFYDAINPAFNQHRNKKLLPEKWGISGPALCTYYSNNALESLGARDNADKRTGKWYYFAENSVKLAEGLYSNGEKAGTWTYFDQTGTKNQVEDFNTGAVHVYNPGGIVTQHYFLKNKLVEGTVTDFFQCGAALEKIPYQAGVRNGKGQVFLIDGKVSADYEFKNDSLDGPYVTYFESGKVKISETMAKGKSNGPYTKYASTGNPIVEGQYKSGVAYGAWKYHYDNGQPSQKGQYDNDIAVGEWEYFDRAGILTEKRNFNNKGEFHGDNTVYVDGKIHYRLSYNNDVMTTIIYYDRDGKVKDTYGSPDGTFTGHGSFPTGQLRSDFTYVKGKADGTFRYYNRSGVLESEFQYKEGKLSGEGREYFDSKTLKSSAFYENGDFHGLYRLYHENGKLRSIGWYQNDQRQQRWTEYYSDGQMWTDYYYLNGQKTGVAFDYNPDGSMSSETEYVNGKIKSVNYNKGNLLSQSEGDPGRRQQTTVKYKNGTVAFTVGLTCGYFNGEARAQLSDGKPFFFKAYAYGELVGKYFGAYSTGAKECDGFYKEGNAAGNWTWYHENGKKYSAGKYENDERDSLWSYWHDNGMISTSGTYKNGEKHGLWRHHGWNGEPVLEKMYNDGDVVAYRLIATGGEFIQFNGTGRIIALYANGKPAIEEFYLNGHFDNARTTFFPDGTVCTTANHKDGFSDGEDIAYYPSGKVKEKVTLKYGERQGKREHYDESGKLTRTEDYLNDILHGSVVFYSDGKVTRTQKFAGGTPTE